ncbi:MAG: PEP/pyruvate-binding domain-containing protein [Nanoarchaeota archaeon]|nr:PEP/pyruvate-binding domain-containing protein [Nanoarchaeota archaeon]
MEKKEILNKDIIRWLSEIDLDDKESVGTKASCLGKIIKSKFNVPNGFVITADAIDNFLKKEKIYDKINPIVESINIDDKEDLKKRSKEIRAIIEDSNFSKELVSEILESYNILGSEKIDTRGVSQDAINILKHSYESIFVSIRSSVVYDNNNYSHSGLFDSFINIKGERSVLEHIRKCISSLYTSRAIFYREKFNIKDKMAVIIQTMVDSQKSGVVFSKNPLKENDDIIIESIYGLGIGITSGKITPDRYTLDKDIKIKDIKTSIKKIAVVRSGSGENSIVRLNNEKSSSQVLSNGQIYELAGKADSIAGIFNSPQKIEFAIDAEKIYITEVRPITGTRAKISPISGQLLLEGIGAGLSTGSGIIKVIRNRDDLMKLKKGDVLVCNSLSSDFIIYLDLVSGILTNEGGMTSNDAIIAREFLIPCVVGLNNANEQLPEGRKITLDSVKGKVFDGEIANPISAEILAGVDTERLKLQILIDVPEDSESASKSKINEVGLFRIETSIAREGKHPLYYEKENQLNIYADILSKSIEKASYYFSRINIRTSDIRTDEYTALLSSPQKESNPILGLHGIRFSLKHPKIFEAEISAIRNIAMKFSSKRFGVVLPHLISLDEMIKAKGIFNKYKLNNMELGVIIDTPSSVQIIDEIISEADFIIISLNGLIQHTLAIDKEEENVKHLFDYSHPSIYSKLKRVISSSRRFKKDSSLLIESEIKDELLDFLVRRELNNLIISADKINEISVRIKKLEELYKEQNKEQNKKYLVDKSPKTGNQENIEAIPADLEIKEIPINTLPEINEEIKETKIAEDFFNEEIKDLVKIEKEAIKEDRLYGEEELKERKELEDNIITEIIPENPADEPTIEDISAEKLVENNEEMDIDGINLDTQPKAEEFISDVEEDLNKNNQQKERAKNNKKNYTVFDFDEGYNQ